MPGIARMAKFVETLRAFDRVSNEGLEGAHFAMIVVLSFGPKSGADC